MNLGRDPSSSTWGFPVEEQLCHLLRNRRSTFNKAQVEQISLQRAHHCQHINARVTPESSILSRQRCRDEGRREGVSGEPHASRPVFGQRFVQRNALAIDDRRRGGG